MVLKRGARVLEGDFLTGQAFSIYFFLMSWDYDFREREEFFEYLFIDGILFANRINLFNYAKY